MSRESKRLKCVLLGELSLLRGCGEVWLAAGHEIVAIGSGDPSLRKWATAIGARAVELQAEDLQRQLCDLQFDYLFSITNFKVMREEVLDLATEAAINFHDGLLPQYAGLNVPCWAIINGEQEHGITWHCMSADVDRGGVLVQDRFEIDTDDTAFSVNAKCYEAGLASFSRLVDQLASGELRSIPQGANVHYFGLRDRPRAQGILDLKQPADTLSRLSRAMDFGRYFNPMGLPKLWLGHRAIVVGSARVTGDATEATPGTIIAISDETLEVAVGAGVIEFSALRSLNGTPVGSAELGLSEGDLIPLLGDELSDEISAEHRNSCVGESGWLSTFQRVEWLDCPYLESPGGVGSHPIEYPIGKFDPSESSRALIFSVLMAYLARISRRTEFHVPVGFSSAGTAALLDELFCRQTPVEIAVDQNTSLTGMVEWATALIDRHRDRPRFAWDLLLRAPDIGQDQRDYLTLRAPIGVLFAEADTAPDKERLVRRSPLQFVVRPGSAEIIADGARVSDETAATIAAEIMQLLAAALREPSRPLGEHDFLTNSDREQLRTINATEHPHEPQCMHRQVETQAAATPSETALIFRDGVLSYTELNESANRLAGVLIETGVRSDDLVGLMLDRSPDMVIGLLAILKAGAAYVPMDPRYPAERLEYIARDSGAKVVITSNRQQVSLGAEVTEAIVAIDELGERLAQQSGVNPNIEVQTDALCYVMYTSGSTGNPKGVMVEHRQVSNFLLGMDSRIAANGRGTWLAETSISFDISVLELFWSLSRGFAVVLYREDESGSEAAPRLGTRYPGRPMEFGLFYWNVAHRDDSNDPDRYRLLIEGAKFADQHEFSAVWTPERHFGSFGGLYPNPAVTGAALAAITRNVGVRAGSCVVPLHHPIRIAEEWSVVDVLSGGRVGVSMAAGWMPSDFAIRPENFADAKTKLFEGIDQVRRLWRGETLTFPGPRGDVEVSTLPRPIQA